jgi:predicted TIM-barrel fold metal-dependent hydrolase
MIDPEKLIALEKAILQRNRMNAQREQLIADAVAVGAIKRYQDLTAFNKGEVAYFEITLDNLVDFAAIRDKRKDAEIARLQEALENIINMSPFLPITKAMLKSEQELAQGVSDEQP